MPGRCAVCVTAGRALRCRAGPALFPAPPAASCSEPPSHTSASSPLCAGSEPGASPFILSDSGLGPFQSPRPLNVLRESLAGRGGHPESPKVGSPRKGCRQGETPSTLSVNLHLALTAPPPLRCWPLLPHPFHPPLPQPPCTSGSSCRVSHTPSILQEAHSCSQRCCWRHLGATLGEGEPCLGLTFPWPRRQVLGEVDLQGLLGDGGAVHVLVGF